MRALSGRFVLSALAVLLAGLVLPSPAEAQWYGGVYLGANHTHPAPVTIDQPAIGRVLTFDDVEFDARPFESPQYYGWRAGYLFGQGRRLGVELEFIHLKVIGLTDRTYPVSGDAGGDGIGPGAPMNAVVQRYSMTHGHNFLLVNLVSRTPLGQGPVALVLRSGIGPTLPHAESTIDGETREQYEYAGIGSQVAAGLDVRVFRAVSATVEYKFTYSRPEITVAHGVGRTRTATHQVAAGLAFGLPR
jgi:opacity protein-like surface antigen